MFTMIDNLLSETVYCICGLKSVLALYYFDLVPRLLSQLLATTSRVKSHVLSFLM